MLIIPDVGGEGSRPVWVHSLGHRLCQEKRREREGTGGDRRRGGEEKPEPSPQRRGALRGGGEGGNPGRLLQASVDLPTSHRSHVDPAPDPPTGPLGRRDKAVVGSGRVVHYCRAAPRPWYLEHILAVDIAESREGRLQVVQCLERARDASRVTMSFLVLPLREPTPTLQTWYNTRFSTSALKGSVLVVLRST